jgi:hypothetical protein
LILEFIFVGFNREDDLDKGRCKVIPSANPPWLLLMVMYRTAFEYAGITLDRICKIYKVRKIKGKVYNLERVVTMESTSRMHRRFVASGKNVNICFAMIINIWMQLTLVSMQGSLSDIEEFLSAEAKNE